VAAAQTEERSGPEQLAGRAAEAVRQLAQGDERVLALGPETRIRTRWRNGGIAQLSPPLELAREKAGDVVPRGERDGRDSG